MCLKAALARSHMMYSTRIDLVEAHEGVGLEGGRIAIRSRVGSVLPLRENEVAAALLQWGIGSALGWIEIGLQQ